MAEDHEGATENYYSILSSLTGENGTLHERSFVSAITGVSISWVWPLCIRSQRRGGDAALCLFTVVLGVIRTRSASVYAAAFSVYANCLDGYLDFGTYFASLPPIVCSP